MDVMDANYEMGALYARGACGIGAPRRGNIYALGLAVRLVGPHLLARMGMGPPSRAAFILADRESALPPSAVGYVEQEFDEYVLH
jgi:hypothetical protein